MGLFLKYRGPMEPPARKEAPVTSPLLILQLLVGHRTPAMAALTASPQHPQAPLQLQCRLPEPPS